jgi:flagellin-specific chaperone FliS
MNGRTYHRAIWDKAIKKHKEIITRETTCTVKKHFNYHLDIIAELARNLKIEIDEEIMENIKVWCKF